MFLKVYNGALIEDQEQTYLTVAGVAGDTALTVAATDLAPAGTSSNTWANNDYMIVGKIGEEGTEVMQMSAAVTSSTSLTVDREGQSGGLRNAHPIGTPIYRINYNQVQFYRNATDTTSGASTLATSNLQADDLFTSYEDTANTTGYGFARFYNATSTAFSSYSDGVNYEISGNSSSRDPRTLWMIRNKVRLLLDEPTDAKLKDARIDDSINDRQREISHKKLWQFLEDERSFSSVADQHYYVLPARVKSIHGVTFDTQPLAYTPHTKFKNLHWNSNSQSTTISACTIWGGELLLWPRPSASAASTTLGAAVSTTTATTITVAATASFNRGDYYRFIIDSEVIYATEATTTTFTGCRRGMEGTTAATHTNGTTVTERDIVYGVQSEAADLVDIADRTSIPEADILAYGAAIDLADFVGKEDKKTFLQGKYDVLMKNLENNYEMKETSQFGRVKASEELISDTSTIVNPNQYPVSIG